jgi:adenylate kinase
MIVVFLGPPGAGKGTQCKLLVDRYGLRHLSSGDILRRERQQDTDLGKKAQAFMDSGQLVPDDLIVAMMIKEMSGNQNGDGFVLDGFPRTLGQAAELDKALKNVRKKVDVVLDLEVDDNKLELRVTGRRTCSQCGTAYHVVFNPPQKDGLCNLDGAALVQRSDDTPDVVRNRIKTYHQQTAPLISYYEKQSNLHRIDGNIDINLVTKSLFHVMDSVARVG